MSRREPWSQRGVRLNLGDLWCVRDRRRVLVVFGMNEIVKMYLGCQVVGRGRTDTKVSF